MANPAYLQLIGNREVLGKTVAEAQPDAVKQGYLDLLDEVYRSGKAFSTTGARYEVSRAPGTAPIERYVDFVYQPIADAEGKVTGIFVEGFDVTGAHPTPMPCASSTTLWSSGWPMHWPSATFWPTWWSFPTPTSWPSTCATTCWRSTIPIPTSSRASTAIA